MSLKLITPEGKESTLSDRLGKVEGLKLGGQFVVIESWDVRYACLFRECSWRKHANIVAHFSRIMCCTFIAAGWYNRWNKLKPHVQYESITCHNRYGYDRPEDSAEADKLLEELQTLLSE